MRLILVAARAIAPVIARDTEPAARLDEAGACASETVAPDESTPEDMLANSHCVVMAAESKIAAFVIRGKCGKGATLRQDVDDNATLRGRKLQNRRIVTTARRTPGSQ